MTSRTIARAVPARALALSILLVAPLAQAGAIEPTVLKPLLATVRALPAAPPMKEEDFSRRALVREVKLSPDGKRLAYLETEGASASLYLLELESGERRKLAASLGRTEVHWSGNSTTLFLDSGDALSVIGTGDSAPRRIASFDRKLGQRMVAVDEPRRAALVEEFDRAAKRYRLSRVTADGTSTLLHEGERKLKDFLLDAGGQPVFSVALDERYEQVVSRKQDGKWREAARCKPRRVCYLTAASPDLRKLAMVSEHGDDRSELIEIDIASKAVKVLHADPLGHANLRNVSVSATSGKPLFAFYDLPMRRNYGLTPETKAAADDIARAFPDTNITISAPEAAPRWLLTERGARLNAERYWLYDRASHSFEQLLRQERARGGALPEQQLAQKIPLHYRASDGMLIHGYLSLPPGRDPASVPLLTMVHGGPWSEVDSGYSTLVQLVVNRGVAVFQPNFRASAGYGARYMLAPKADFGNGRVQADIIEGVRWLLDNGVGDRQRLAIMGDSFGGYSTLLALTHTPELFRFGMATVPPTDFARTMKAAAAGGGSDGGDEMPFSMLLGEMGLSVDDAAMMRQMAEGAPAAHPEKVSRPLVILAGARDDKVDIGSVTAYAERLQALGRPVSLLVDPDEGHNPRKPIVRQAYVYLLGQLMHQHLGASAPPAPSPELVKYLGQSMKMSGALK